MNKITHSIKFEDKRQDEPFMAEIKITVEAGFDPLEIAKVYLYEDQFNSIYDVSVVKTK